MPSNNTAKKEEVIKKIVAQKKILKHYFKDLKSIVWIKNPQLQMLGADYLIDGRFAVDLKGCIGSDYTKGPPIEYKQNGEKSYLNKVTDYYLFILVSKEKRLVECYLLDYNKVVEYNEDADYPKMFHYSFNGTGIYWQPNSDLISEWKNNKSIYYSFYY